MIVHQRYRISLQSVQRAGEPGCPSRADRSRPQPGSRDLLGALDALTRIEMQRLVEQVWLSHGLTAILVTHDVVEAVALADRIVLIEAGAIAGDFPVDLKRPRASADRPISPASRRRSSNVCWRRRPEPRNGRRRSRLSRAHSCRSSVTTLAISGFPAVSRSIGVALI